MDRRNPRLLIVYNADGGVLNALKDAVWKIVSPVTYPCSLCALTYGAVSMRAAWRRYLDGLPMETIFHHRDDFAASYLEHGVALPAILVRYGEDAPRIVISAEELNAMESLDILIAAMKDRLATA